MSTPNPGLESIRKSAGFRLSVLFGSFFILLLLASIVSLFVDKLPGDGRTHALIASVAQCLLAFCVPAFLLAKFSSNKSIEWLFLTKVPTLKAIIGVVIVYLISMPAMEWLITWNSELHLPESLSGIEEILRTWEANGEAATKELLDAHGIWAVLAGVLVIGVLTGFSEEVFFRGGLQGIIERTKLGAGTSIWVGAIIFSMMHFQFFGFFPRLLMGAFFGYLLIWTRSLWVPIFAHVLNNSVVVIISAITGETSGCILDSDIAPTVGNSMMVVVSVLLTALFLFIFKDNIFKNESWQKRRQARVTGK